MTRVLALDLGTACGWALVDYDPTDMPGIEAFRPRYGTFDLRAGQHAGGGMRYLKFRRELDAFKGQVDEVTYEIVRRHVGTAAAHVYGGLLAVLTGWCEENSIPYEGRTVQAIKKYISGTGNADKAAVVKAVEQRGFSPKNDNEADAIALLLLRLSETDQSEPVVPLPESGRSVAGKARHGASGR